jgi:Na+-transporting methylmalonyl-CoA/oxaloacetate decarboxylase gamma subunit
MKDFIAILTMSIQLMTNIFAAVKKAESEKEKDEIIAAARAHDRDRLLALLHKQ